MNSDFEVTLEGLSLESLKSLARARHVTLPSKPKREGVLAALEELRAARHWTVPDLLRGGPEQVVPQVQSAAGGQNILNLTSPQAFDTGGRGRAQRWEQYVCDFRNYLSAVGIQVEERKTAVFLHVAGSDIARLAKTLRTPTSRFEDLIRALTDALAPGSSELFENHKLGSLRHKEGESTDDFVNRLRGQAQMCRLKCRECGASYQDDRILEILLNRTHLSRLPERVFERNLKTLDEVLLLARTMETVARQAQEMRVAESRPTVHQVPKQQSARGGAVPKGKPQQHQQKQSALNTAKMWKVCGTKHPVK